MNDHPAPSLRALLAPTLAAWLIYLAADFLLHAAILAGWWRATAEYWLPPMQLFQLIPFAYAAFAIYCAALCWLLMRLYGSQPSLAQGLRFGAIAGLIFGAVSILGNYSVFSVPPSALLVWPLTLLIESAAAGGIAAWVLNAPHRWRRVGVVIGIALGLIILGIIVQNVLFPVVA